MTLEIIGSVVRSLITTLGASLLTQGVITADQLNTLGGAATVLIALAWSIWQKKKAAGKK